MSKRGLFLALLGLTCAAAPVGAQSASVLDDEYTVTVQNNRDEQVTVYVDMLPFERTLGTLEPMQTATFALPEAAVRNHDSVRLLIEPEGGLLLQAEAMVNPRHEDVQHFALMMPLDEDDDLTPLSSDELAAALPSSAVGTTVTVHNDENQPADVYMLAGTESVRLGRVSGDSIMTFQVPSSWVGRTAELIVAPEGSLDISSTHVALGQSSHVGVLLD
jgi:hypothetical protein